MLRCAVCCRCFGLEAVPQFKDVRFVAVALASKWCPNARKRDLLSLLWSANAMMCDLLSLLWSRSGAPMRRYTIRCLCSGLEVVPPHAKMYDLKPLLWSPRCPNAEMCDLLPLLLSRSGAPMLRCTICCRCLALEVVLQC